MDKSESEEQFGSNSQTIIDSVNVETPEQRVATNVSQQLLSNAFESQIESQIEPKREKGLNESESETGGQRAGQPLDVFDQQLNQNIVKPTEQRVINSSEQLDKGLGVYDYEPEYEVEYEDEEEDDDSLNEPNTGSDVMFKKVENPSQIKGNEEILYQLSDDSSVLRAKNYGIGSDLRIDSQSNPNIENVSDYQLNSEDPFQTPEKKVAENIQLTQKYEDLITSSQPFESVSTDFGISSMVETNNLLDFDINSPKNESNVRPISHTIDSNDTIEVKSHQNPSQSSSESDDDMIAYDKNEDPYVVTSFAETFSLNESSDSTTTNRNDIEFSSAPNLEPLNTTITATNTTTNQHFTEDSPKLSQHLQQSVQQQTQQFDTKSIKVEKELFEDKSETPFVPIIPKAMAKTQESKASSTTSVASDTCPFGPSEWFNPKHMNPTVAELVYWRNPKNSGIVFGSGLVLLICLTFFSIISVVAYASLAALSVTLSFRIYKNILQAVQKTSEGHPFKEYLEVEITPSNERIHQIADSILSHVNCTLNKLRSVFLVEDIVDSLKFVVLFWCLTYIGHWFNGLTLIILAYLALFSVPKVYEMNKTQIDQYLNLASTQINDITSKIRAKIPFPAKKEKDN